MEESRSVTIGFASSEAICETRLHNALDNIASEVNAALHFSDYLSDDDYTRIGRLKTKLERLLPSPSEIRIGSLNSNVAPRFLQVSAHYSDLYIRRYRKIANLNIGKLRRINLFVGGEQFREDLPAGGRLPAGATQRPERLSRPGAFPRQVFPGFQCPMGGQKFHLSYRHRRAFQRVGHAGPYIEGRCARKYRQKLLYFHDTDRCEYRG